VRGKALPIVDFLLTPHASSELRRRGLDEDLVRQVLADPEQRTIVRPGREVVQAKFTLGGKRYLVRVFVDVDRKPPEVVTTYRTSKIDMKIAYDRTTDSLTVILKEGVAVAESDEGKPGVILDYDQAGDLLAIEILDASRRVTDARKIEYETT
jgi:uncharacterized protein YuzE